MSRSVTSNRLQELRVGLTERDWAIISTLAMVRVATSRHLVELHLSDVGLRRAQRKLSHLVNRRILARLPRTIGGPRAGSSGHVYALDVAGQRLANLGGGGRVRRPWALGRGYLAHALAVTDVYVRLVLAERAGSLRLLRFAAESASWRSFFGPVGSRVWLKPDAYAVVNVGGWEDHWFIEVDLDTEHAPIIARRCTVYRDYRRSGTEQARHELFPRVLRLVPNEHRASMLRRVLNRLPDSTRDMFDVALLDAVAERMLQGAAP